MPTYRPLLGLPFVRFVLRGKLTRMSVEIFDPLFLQFKPCRKHAVFKPAEVSRTARLTAYQDMSSAMPKH